MGEGGRPDVTVLLPAYNGWPHIRRAVESVLAQRGADFECLIVDDASTDASAGWLQALTDSRVRVLRLARNGGQVAALNEGLRQARGAYVARLDQDDLCLPGRLQRQTAVLDAAPDIAALGTCMQAIDGAGRRLPQQFGQRVRCDGEAAGLLLRGICPLQHPSVMYRREAVLAAGGYDPGFQGTADYELWTRLLLRHARLRVLPEIWGCYRVHAAQQSVRVSPAHHAQWHRAHEALVRQAGAGPQAGAVSRLLRLDAAWWQRQPTAAQRAACEGFLRLLRQAGERLGLGAADARRMRQLLQARVGWGPLVQAALPGLPAGLWRAVVLAASPALLLKRRHAPQDAAAAAGSAETPEHDPQRCPDAAPAPAAR